MEIQMRKEKSEMMSTLISIIVPIYNVEQYLDRCVESLVSQTYENIEIILVDDGSLDGCPKKCDEWEQKDSRIIVIHKENGGLSDARNTGIEVAQGEFLAFVDSDDYVAKEYIEILYSSLVRTNSDIVTCNYYYSYTSGKIIESSVKMQEGVYSARKFTNFSIHSNFGYDYAWNKLYRKDLFYHLRYKIGKFYEDVFIITDLMEICKKIAIIDSYLYYYTERDDSICGESRGKFTPKIFDLYEGWNYRIASYLRLGWAEEALYSANRSYNQFLEVIKLCYCDNQLNKMNAERIIAILGEMDQTKLVDYRMAYHWRFGKIVSLMVYKNPQNLIVYKKIQNLLRRVHVMKE